MHEPNDPRPTDEPAAPTGDPAMPAHPDAGAPELVARPSNGSLSAGPLSNGDPQAENAPAENALTGLQQPIPNRLPAILLAAGPALAVAMVSLFVFLVTSTLVVAVASVVIRGSLDPRLVFNPETMRMVTESRIGFLFVVVTPQIALLVPSVIATLASPTNFSRRLSLVRGHWPVWAWAAAAAATPLIGWISTVVVSSFMDQSKNLEMMAEVFRGHGESGFLIPLALVIGATPAICEELLFRGYVQTGLNATLGPVTAILLSSLLFAAFHMDPVHSIAVFPLGVYLGVLTWRSGSILPAMLAHFVNNTISVIAVVTMPAEPGDLPSPQAALFLLGVIGIAFLGAATTAVAFWHLPGPRLVSNDTPA